MPRPHSSVYLGLLRLSAYTVVRVATSARSAEQLIRADHAPSGARAEAAGGAGVAVPKMLPGCRLDLEPRSEGAPRREGRGARIWRQYIRSSQNAPAARWAQFTVLQGTTVYCARRIAMASAIGEIGRHVSGATSTSTLHYYVNYEVQFDGFAIRARVIRGPTLRGL